jgi:hypothetical protein
VAARVTANKTTKQNNPPLLAISMTVVVRQHYTAHRPMEVVRDFPKSH